MTDAHLSEERMADYLRGGAEEASERELEAHVARCVRCAERLAVEARVDVAAHQLAEQAAPVRAPKPRSRGTIFALRGALALAAAGVLAFELQATRDPRGEIARDVLPVIPSTASASSLTPAARESDPPAALPEASSVPAPAPVRAPVIAPRVVAAVSEVGDASVPSTAARPGRVVGAHTSGVGNEWFLAGSAPERYVLSVDTSVHHGGASSIEIESRPNAASDGFSTAMQSLPAAPHVGQRVRLSAYVRTEGVTSWAGLWLRVDGAERPPLAFDNMQDRPITGTTGWTRYTVVLPVAAGAKSLALGVLENGPGRVWMDDVVLEDLP